MTTAAMTSLSSLAPAASLLHGFAFNCNLSSRCSHVVKEEVACAHHTCLDALQSPLEYSAFLIHCVAWGMQFHAVLRGDYLALLSRGDEGMLPLLARFQELTAFSRARPPPAQLRSPAVIDYYTRLFHKYIPGGVLRL